jgi:hypothetical protein
MQITCQEVNLVGRGWRAVYRHRAVKESGLLRVGLQVLIEPVQPIFNQILPPRLMRHGNFDALPALLLTSLNRAQPLPIWFRQLIDHPS